MKESSLLGNCGKIVLKDNVLAVLSDIDLSTISSAFYNGGCRKAKAILNVQAPKEYSDRELHGDPERIIVNSAKKLGLSNDFVGMFTAAAVDKFSLVSKKEGNLAINVAATAVDPEGNTCSHAESAGENIEVEEINGTINIIVVIDGNPTESCLVSTVITATEAKMAALRELDVRSRYSGDEATGTITDAIIVAKTDRGAPIIYGGPASRLGQLVGYCTKKAVKEAIMKANECKPSRSFLKRLNERHLPIEKLVQELSKVPGLKLDQKSLTKLFETDSFFVLLLIAATKIDEDVKKGLIPTELGSVDMQSELLGGLLSKTYLFSKSPFKFSEKDDFASVDLPPFLKFALINLLS